MPFNINGNKDFTLVDIPLNSHNQVDKDNYHDNKGDKDLNPKESERRESIATASADFDNVANAIKRQEAEDYLRNIIFYVDFKRKFLQMLVTLALLILAVEWQQLQQLLRNHVWYLFFSFWVLTIITLVNNFASCLAKINGLTELIHILHQTSYFWVMATFFNFYVFTPQCIVLSAVTKTTNYFFLGIFVYFQKASYRGCAIYGYALIVPLLFLILSQPFYFWVHLKFTVYYLIMSYNDYMINVCAGIGIAIILNLETIAWMKRSLMELQYKDGVGIFYGSLLLHKFEQPDVVSVPVNV